MERPAKKTKGEKKEKENVYEGSGCPFVDVNNKDVIEKIMKYLPAKDITSLGATCEKMRALSERESLWFHLLRRDFGVERDPVFDRNTSNLEIYKQEKEFEEKSKIEFSWDRNSIWDLKNDLDVILRWSCRKGGIETVKCCLRRGVDVNKGINHDITALMFASDYGHEEVIELLLNKGADINKQNKNGWTALMRASKYGYDEIIELLLNKGADINKADVYGWTSLIFACRYSKSIETVQALLARPEIDVNKENKFGWTALMMACRYSNSIETVQALLAHPDIDVNKQEEDGWTALMIAKNHRHGKIIELLSNWEKKQKIKVK